MKKIVIGLLAAVLVMAAMSSTASAADMNSPNARLGMSVVRSLNEYWAFEKSPWRAMAARCIRWNGLKGVSCKVQVWARGGRAATAMFDDCTYARGCKGGLGKTHWLPASAW